ncbi:cathelicidin-3-like [Ciconia maguari]
MWGDAPPWLGSGEPGDGCHLSLVGATALSPSPSPQDAQLSSPQRLDFITETRRPARSGARRDACELKDDGVRALGGSPTSRGVPSLGTVPPTCPHTQPPALRSSVPWRGGRPALDVTCADSAVDPVRVKHFWPLLTVAIKTVATSISVFKATKRK